MPRSHERAPRLSRRAVLLAGTGLTTGLMLAALPVPAMGQEASAAGFEEFMRLSARLTGKDSLMPAQGRVAFEALSERFPDFGRGVAEVIGFMDEHGVEASRLQAALDEAGSEAAWVPRQVVSAWYLGVVGAVESPADAEAGLVPPEAVEGSMPPIRAIAWEQALMFAPLAGTIPIPSFAFDGDWTEKPAQGD